MNFPIYARGQVITAGAVSTSHALTDTAAQSARDVLVYNPGPANIRITTGGQGTVADDLSMVLIAGEKGAYGKASHTHVAVMTVGGAPEQDVQVWVGEGS